LPVEERGESAPTSRARRPSAGPMGAWPGRRPACRPRLAVAGWPGCRCRWRRGTALLLREPRRGIGDRQSGVLM